MQITGDHVEWVDCFSCVGTWTKGDFYCDLDRGVTTAGPGGEPCPSEPWVVLQQDPNPERPLEPGEIYAGIPVSNAFNAHCASSPGNSRSGYIDADAAVDEESHRVVVPLKDHLVQDARRLMGAPPGVDICAVIEEEVRGLVAPCQRAPGSIKGLPL
jgi:hypothetical protein